MVGFMALGVFWLLGERLLLCVNLSPGEKDPDLIIMGQKMKDKVLLASVSLVSDFCILAWITHTPLIFPLIFISAVTLNWERKQYNICNSFINSLKALTPLTPLSLLQ